jgi:NodT family efflux transporter outer membrane factor (OMF) lipoprotein
MTLEPGETCNRKMKRGRIGWSGLALVCAALAGCTVGPNYHKPDVPMAPAYRETPPPPNPANGTWKDAQPADEAARGKWWTVYSDPQLNALEDKVAVDNQTLKAAYQQYIQAREQVAVYRSNFFPTLSAGPNVSRNRLSHNRPTSFPTAKSQYNDFQLTGQVSWEPDFWGLVRRQVEGSAASAQATAADLANAELSIRSELALDYFELRGLDTQKQLLDRTVTDYEQYLKLTQVRFKGGVATDSDVALAETQLNTTRTQAIDVSVARAQYEHAIAVLIGQPASAFSLPEMPLNLALPNVPAGVPSELLERRPDIAAAERRAAAANAQIGVARAAYYPDVRLGGSGGFESANGGTLLQGPSALWSLGATATELIFDAGRRHAVNEQAKAAYEMQVANYRQSVLNAFEEVEDNLSALRILDQETGSASAAVNSAKRSLQISTHRYKGGVTTYLEVLTAQSAQLADERTQADITTRQFAASVQLIKALGGGWDTTQLPKP